MILILVCSRSALQLYHVSSFKAVSYASLISLGLSLYMATYLGSCSPYARFFMTMQKSDTSVWVAESAVP